jgi:hypothetical protein
MRRDDLRRYDPDEIMDMGGPEKIFQTGSLAAKTSRLPLQPLTSHPSIKGELDKGNYIRHNLRGYSDIA